MIPDVHSTLPRQPFSTAGSAASSQMHTGQAFLLKPHKQRLCLQRLDFLPHETMPFKIWGAGNKQGEPYDCPLVELVRQGHTTDSPVRPKCLELEGQIPRKRAWREAPMLTHGGRLPGPWGEPLEGGRAQGPARGSISHPHCGPGQQSGGSQCTAGKDWPGRTSTATITLNKP